MFSINMDDERSLWEKEVKHFNIPWKMIGDTKGMKSDLAKGYNIHGIPMIFLISPDGTIHSSTLRREEMVKFFKKMYNK